MPNPNNVQIIIVFLLASGLLYLYSHLKSDDQSLDQIDWCIPGANMMMPQEMNMNTSEDQIFVIKGNTTYNGKEVCQAEINYSDGILIQYFTQNDEATFDYKDINGNIINKIEINRTSFGTINEDTYYDEQN